MRLSVLSAAMLFTGVQNCLAAEPVQPVTPIRHVVIVVGENTAFDTVFATFKPASGATVANLLSRGIVDEEGNPGPQFSRAIQKIPAKAGRFAVDFEPGEPYQALPVPWGRERYGTAARQDGRIPDKLPAGPYPITRYIPYGTYTGSDPVHRFFQMWQQVNGGRHDLFAWVGQTSGEGSTQKGSPSSGTNHGGEALGFYNMQKGDAAWFAGYARRFALADNYHQSVMGGTMPNYIALATGDVAVHLDEGKPVPPPAGEIENPEPLGDSPNWYIRSGYSSGSYTGCADRNQPGVAGVYKLIDALPYPPFRAGNCDANHFYLVNNYTPPFEANGERRRRQAHIATPQTMPTIAEALAAAGVSWKWYSGGRDGERSTKEYCSVCDTLSFFPAVMESPLRQRLQGLKELYADIEGEMPAVSFVVPPNSKSGHPGYSNLAALERFLADIVGKIEARPALWADTAILVTFDEGGGYYDSGPIQIIDFFGDGTRVPLLAISPWARKGHVEHTYYDHASILKFIERNWRLKPLSVRSRDNLPNPQAGSDPYVPANRPAIGDLFELFEFKKP